MNDNLKALIERSRNVEMTPEQETAQRRSFAYGNTKIENDLITRKMIDELDEKLNAK